MKYLDSGSRDPTHTLAGWFLSIIGDEILEFRFQSGFFSINGIGLILPLLSKSKQEDLVVSCLIGANELTTLAVDITQLMEIVGAPREKCQIGIVSYSHGFFHPKTFHMTRTDGSQAAFVGSANLTGSGLSLHVEAGITLDTKEGDPEVLLQEIGSSIEAWFSEGRDGLVVLNDYDVIGRLVADKTLAISRPPKPKSGSGSSVKSQKNYPVTKLNSIVKLPKFEVIKTGKIKTGGPHTKIEGTKGMSIGPTILKEGFPGYMFFAPSKTEPTIGEDALSGTNLAGGALGLIIQLNRDSARHFMGGTGTANISIPVAVANTIRFGIFGKHSRPRAEFTLSYQYISADQIYSYEGKTNIMAYGYGNREKSGHKDIRMLVPRDVSDLVVHADDLKNPHPTIGDLALLEWPNPIDGNLGFRLSLMAPDSVEAAKAQGLFVKATAEGELIGKGACWLPIDFFD